MTFDEFTQAVDDAIATNRRADVMVRKLASMCINRLRSAGIDGNTLDRLKIELRNWNIHTQTWKG